MARTGQHVVDSESRRPKEMAETLDQGASYLQNQVTEFDRNLKGAKWYIERDVQRFQERTPRNAQRTWELFWAKPERIEENAILLFF